MAWELRRQLTFLTISVQGKSGRTVAPHRKCGAGQSVTLLTLHRRGPGALLNRQHRMSTNSCAKSSILSYLNGLKITARNCNEDAWPPRYRVRRKLLTVRRGA